MITKNKTLLKILFIALDLAALLCPVAAQAQTLDHVGAFWGFTDVQFLPGGYVVENSDGQTRHYRYRNHKFEELKGEIPALVRGWASFSGDADYLDEVDASARLDSGLKALLPKGARVKRHYEIMLAGKRGALAVICYTQRIRIEGANAKDIFVTAALDMNPYEAQSGYRKFWSAKVASESNYGDFQYEVVPGLGAFLLLYSNVVGGDAIEHHLDVYRMRELERADGGRQRP